jgi:hypothetical protein
MGLRRLTAVAATGIAAVGIAAATMATPVSAYADTTPTTMPTTAPTTTPGCAPLPSYVDGRPAHLHPLAATGDYLWHDANGWHLRVTHPARNRTVFRGVITTSSPITFQRVRDEKRDKVVLSSDKRTLVFRFDWGATTSTSAPTPRGPHTTRSSSPARTCSRLLD